jgi:hypothetical protein
VRLKLRKRNNDLMVILPQELTSSLNWSAGDFVDANVVDGNLVVVGKEMLRACAMRIARKVMQQYRKTFEDLSKR